VFELIIVVFIIARFSAAPEFQWIMNVIWEYGQDSPASG